MTFTVAMETSSGSKLHVEILDMDHNVVAETSKALFTGTLTVPKFKPWWPWTESKADYTYMYTLKVRSSFKTEQN